MPVPSLMAGKDWWPAQKRAGRKLTLLSPGCSLTFSRWEETYLPWEGDPLDSVYGFKGEVHPETPSQTHTELCLIKYLGTTPMAQSVQFSSVAQSCPTLGDPMSHSTPGLPVHHQLPEFTQTHVHRVGDAIQPSHPLSSPSPPAPNPSQHQGLFQWVSSSHQVAKGLEFQLQHQSFQWTPRTDLL